MYEAVLDEIADAGWNSVTLWRYGGQWRVMIERRVEVPVAGSWDDVCLEEKVEEGMGWYSGPSANADVGHALVDALQAVARGVTPTNMRSAPHEARF